MAGPARQTDHVGDAASLMLEQFKDKELLQAFLAAFTPEVQELEDALWSILTERALDVAVGAQLDGIGQILNRPRAGDDDDAYRDNLKTEVLVHKSDGTTEAILEILTRVLGDGVSIRTVQGSDAEFWIQLRGTVDPARGRRVANYVRRARGAAIAAHVQFYGTNPHFGFAGGTGEGFGVGHLAGVVVT